MAHLRANLVAYLALFIALGGTGAWAADKITARDIAKRAVHSKHIKENAVRTKHIRNGAVTAKKLAAGVEGLRGAPGPQGAAGPPGSPGSAGSPDTAQQVLDKLKSVDGSGSELDADALDTLDSSDIGLGFFTGRVNDLIPGDTSVGPPTGMSQAAAIGAGIETLSPDRPIRVRELAGRLTTNAPGPVALVLNASEPDGTFIDQLACVIPAGTRECTAAGPSDLLAARSSLELSIGDNNLFDVLPAGTDLLFSWRAQAP